MGASRLSSRWMTAGSFGRRPRSVSTPKRTALPSSCRADLDAFDHDPRPVPGAALRVLLRKKENALVEAELFLFLCPEEETADFASRLLVGPCRGQRVVDDDESPGRDVLRQALEASWPRLVRVEKGEELRIEGARLPVADRLGETVFRPGGQPQLTCPDPQVAKGPAAGLLREDELAGRCEREFGELLAGTLGGDVHFADGLDLVALEQQPVRPRSRGRVDVDHVSPEAEIPALLDERHPAVAAVDERRGEAVPVDGVADGDRGDEAGHDASRHDLLQECRPGYDDNGGVVFDQGGENADSLPLHVFLRRERIREHEIPGGHEEHRIAAGKEGRILRERARLLGACAEHGHRPPGQLVQSGDEKGLR